MRLSRLDFSSAISTGRVLKRKERSIFVLDNPGGPRFAFEAENVTEAERLSRAPSLTCTLGTFLAARDKDFDESACLRVRAATATEASVYLDFAREFADMSGDVLFVYLSGQATGH
jgi:hypothetical protein